MVQEIHLLAPIAPRLLGLDCAPSLECYSKSYKTATDSIQQDFDLGLEGKIKERRREACASTQRPISQIFSQQPNTVTPRR